MVARNRVLSFMSQFSSNRDSQYNSSPSPTQTRNDSSRYDPLRQDTVKSPASPSTEPQHPQNMNSESQPQVQRERAPSRPMSMVQTYQPPLMDVSHDTLPELQPIFTFLNSHANKLYQEGYFLKLDDQNTHGRANADRTWTECFAQLVGTVLSLWDAAELDAAGQEGEVLPKFINLTDASIKMIESLPTRSDNEAPLQNVLSISTAGKNRYLLHFNSHHSLIQWTAGIRLAMFEHATLQEAYTGALIAGKGKALNNIGVILERSRVQTADWARVRFGAGTPWRRCWCVITPPDEKEVQKLQKQISKKKSAYDRSPPPILKGDIKFYDTKKTKKVRPIATIADAYSAFAIYPQSKPLIDASTLVKVEGSITIHSNPPTTTEGFVFVMPEAHPAVTGFEMMLRWLFPVFDTFGLYGRPTRLVADIADPRSLMFAMPKHRRYGYLEILDVSGLILEQGSAGWRESEWRKRMKDLTGKRMTAIENGTRRDSRYGSRRSARNSYGPTRSRIQFDDSASVRSSPSITWQAPQTDGPYNGIPRTDSAPPASGASTPPRAHSTLQNQHHRSVSETNGLDHFQNQNPTHYDGNFDQAPPPPPHAIGVASPQGLRSGLRYQNEMATTPERLSSEDELPSRATPVRELQELQATTAPEPVAAPPAFSHAPGSLPISKPYHSPELRRANSRMSNATLSQLAGAGGAAAAAIAYRSSGDHPRTSEDQRHQNVGRYAEERGQRGVMSDANTKEFPSNQNGLHEGLTTASDRRFSFEKSSSHPANIDSRTERSHPPPQFPLNSSITLDSYSPADLARLANRSYTPPHTSIPPESTGNVARSQIPPPPHGHISHTSTDSTHSTTSQPSRIQASQSIMRKPLPARKPSVQTPTSAETASSTGSLAKHVIDQSAFDMIGHGDRQLALSQDSQIHRQNSGVSSVYEEDGSTVSPDYASTRAFIDTRKSVEKRRAGVIRTVGSGDEPTHGGKQAGSLVPNIDFGPTLNYASDRLPRKQSPAQGQGMNNFPVDRAPRQRSPAQRPESGGHSRSPTRNAITPDNTHIRNDSGGGRTLAWQPGMSAIGASGGNSPGKRMSITAEQFVQQRAVAAKPQYAHQRQASGNIARGNTPPLVRDRSSELLALGHHSRNSSTDLLQRPGSRGATVTLGPSGTGDITSNLSAREQEHIARVTGQPLIHMAHNNKGSQGSGLVGAIEQREKEKQQMKQGINSQAVQHAINQRQQQAVYQYPDQGTANYRAPASQSAGNMSQYPQSHFPPQGQNQQQWVSTAANVFAQGGGWSAPSPAYTTPPEHGRQSTSQYASRQQYFPPQQGGLGRGNQGFHGHGS